MNDAQYTYDTVSRFVYSYVFLPSRYTGKERDTESGNDYFGARYYASSLGRWLSPDWSAQEEPVPYAKLDDPQSLNLYAYVRNNPLTRVDADGHCDDPGDFCSFMAILGLGAKAMFTFDRNAAQQNDQMRAQFDNPHPVFKSIDGAVHTAENSPAALVMGPGGEAKEAAFVADQIASIGSKVTNITTKLLTPETLEAASREVNGGMKVAKAGGGLFDHAGKVEQGISGLNRQLGHAEKVLARPNLSEEATAALKAQVNTIQNALAKAREAITPHP